MHKVTEPNLRMLHGKYYFDQKNWPLKILPDTTARATIPHTHDFIEIFIVSGGSGCQYSTNGKQPLAVGDAFALWPSAWHDFQNCDNLGVWNCLIGVDLFQQTLAFCPQTPELRYVWLEGPLALDKRGIVSLHLNLESLALCQTHLSEIKRFDEARSLYSHVEQAGHLLLFLAQLSAAMGEEFRAPVELTDSALGCVQQCAVLIQNEIAHAWTIEELCEQLHVSRYHLMHIFKQAKGISPIAYLARCRAERAANLLMRSDLSVNQVADQVGWSDPNYFARRFKAHFGLSATQYRERVHQESLSYANLSETEKRA